MCEGLWAAPPCTGCWREGLSVPGPTVTWAFAQRDKSPLPAEGSGEGRGLPGAEPVPRGLLLLSPAQPPPLTANDVDVFGQVAAHLCSREAHLEQRGRQLPCSRSPSAGTELRPSPEATRAAAGMRALGCSPARRQGRNGT